MPYYPAGHEQQLIDDMISSLSQDQPLRGIRYNNILIDGPGVNDNYDPEMIIEPIVVASYWPSRIAIAGAERTYFSAVLNPPETDTDSAVASEQSFTRKLILEAAIGEIAFNRYRENLPSNLRQFIDQSDFYGSVTTMETCIAQIVPSSVAFISQVIRSRVLKPGDRTAHLYFPSTMLPAPALKQLQNAVRKTVNDEHID